MLCQLNRSALLASFHPLSPPATLTKTTALVCSGPYIMLVECGAYNARVELGFVVEAWSIHGQGQVQDQASGGPKPGTGTLSQF